MRVKIKSRNALINTMNENGFKWWDEGNKIISSSGTGLYSYMNKLFGEEAYPAEYDEDDDNVIHVGGYQWNKWMLEWIEE